MGGNIAGKIGNINAKISFDMNLTLNFNDELNPTNYVGNNQKKFKFKFGFRFDFEQTRWRKKSKTANKRK